MNWLSRVELELNSLGFVTWYYDTPSPAVKCEYYSKHGTYGIGIAMPLRFASFEDKESYYKCMTDHMEKQLSNILNHENEQADTNTG